jgi:hypothetical protein
MKLKFPIPDTNTTAQCNLGSLIIRYNAKCRRRLRKYLNQFQNLALSEVLKCDKLYRVKDDGFHIHSHQRRLGIVVLEKASRKLLKRATEIENCSTFCDLLECVTRVTRNIHPFGALARYDTTLRIGANLRLKPAVVYLHAGARTGCKSLRLSHRRKEYVAIDELPVELRKLKPHEVEDFLCIFKDCFGKMDCLLRCNPCY